MGGVVSIYAYIEVEMDIAKVVILDNMNLLKGRISVLSPSSYKFV